jgi:hypothetical protein
MPREIGWSNEANLLYSIKQLLKKIQGSIYSSNRSTGIDVTPYIITNNGVGEANRFQRDGPVFRTGRTRHENR